MFRNKVHVEPEGQSFPLVLYSREDMFNIYRLLKKSYAIHQIWVTGRARFENVIVFMYRLRTTIRTKARTTAVQFICGEARVAAVRQRQAALQVVRFGKVIGFVGIRVGVRRLSFEISRSTGEAVLFGDRVFDSEVDPPREGLRQSLPSADKGSSKASTISSWTRSIISHPLLRWL